MSLNKVKSKEVNNRSISQKMSSNKRLCLRSNSIKRQSFSNCICDDLAEVILQYLPLKDKLRLECVSKQFQRTIFVKEDEIHCFTYFFSVKPIDSQMKIFETILKKCENINKISLLDDFIEQRFTKNKYNETIELIIKYCNNLTQFDINFNLISKTKLKKFFEKFGSKLMITNYNVNKILPKTHNMIKPMFSALNVTNLKVGPSFEVLSELKFNRLEGLSIKDLQYSQDLDHLEVFIDDNKQMITILSFNCNRIEDNLIPKFVNLEVLNLRFVSTSLSDNQWKQIAVNCLKVKTIFCDLLIDPNSGPINDKLMAPLRAFKSLKCLEIDFRYEELTQIISDYIKTLSFKAFKGFEGLTELCLFCKFDNKLISEDIFTDIDINLPNIQDLGLVSNKIKATEWTADILCRLPKLQDIELNIQKSVQPLIRTRLQKCKIIRSIIFE